MPKGARTLSDFSEEDGRIDPSRAAAGAAVEI